MSEQNWRTEVKAEDYFAHAKKAAQITERRPVPRTSDLVGPGIGATAVRITDYNDLLATFNGFFSSAPGAAGAPNATEAFVGNVFSDAELGGVQTFTGLTSGTEYRRSFTRSPIDPETIGWGEWRGQRIPPTAQGYSVNLTSVADGELAVLAAPALVTIGEPGIYEASSAGVRILKQGVYTGSIQVGDENFDTIAGLSVYRPNGDTTSEIYRANVPLSNTVHIPFTVWATDELQGFSVLASHAEGSSRTLWWRFNCTRIGDAI